MTPGYTKIASVFAVHEVFGIDQLSPRGRQQHLTVHEPQRAEQCSRSLRIKLARNVVEQEHWANASRLLNDGYLGKSQRYDHRSLLTL